MKTPKRVYLATAALLFLGVATGTALVLQSNSEPKRVSIEQVSNASTPAEIIPPAPQPTPVLSVVEEPTPPATVVSSESTGSEPNQCEISYQAKVDSENTRHKEVLDEIELRYSATGIPKTGNMYQAEVSKEGQRHKAELQTIESTYGC